MTMQEKIVHLAQTQQDIATYREVIELLETQLGFYKKRLKEAELLLHQQHETFLIPEPTPVSGMALPIERSAFTEFTTNGKVSS